MCDSVWADGRIMNFQAIYEQTGNFQSGWEGRRLTDGWESNKVFFCRSGWSNSAAPAWMSRMVGITSIHSWLHMHPKMTIIILHFKKAACVFWGGYARSSAGEWSFLQQLWVAGAWPSLASPSGWAQSGRSPPSEASPAACGNRTFKTKASVNLSNK